MAERGDSGFHSYQSGFSDIKRIVEDPYVLQFITNKAKRGISIVKICYNI